MESVLNSQVWIKKINFYIQQLSPEFQEELKDYELEYDFQQALIYNFSKNFKESEKIFYYALERYQNDFRQFLCHSFIWNSTSANDEIDNFTFWFEKIFGRLPLFDMNELLTNKYLYIRKSQSIFGEIYNINLVPDDLIHHYNEKIDIGKLKDFQFEIDYLRYVDDYFNLDYFESNNYKFQIGLTDFEIHVEGRNFYYINNVLFLKNNRFITYAEIDSLIPNHYHEMLDKLGILHDYICEMIEWYRVLILPANKLTKEYFREFVNGSFLNFAEFIYNSFNWRNSKKKFTWWYKTIFGVNFEYEGGAGLTTLQVKEKIYKFNSEDCHSRRIYSDDAEYTTKDSFRDAYGDLID